VDVTTTPEAGRLHASDEEQLAYVIAQGRAIITQDPDFLRMATAGCAHPGMIFYPSQSRSVGQVIRTVQLIGEIYEPEETRNRVEFI
jgi:predicted nuclease of predicted toxin-antitoxin system